MIWAITILYLVLNGLLWYARPSGELWLIGSVVLGVAWMAMFTRTITRR